MSLPNHVMQEKTLFDILRDVWKSKYYMLVCAIVTSALAVTFLTFSQKFYRAEMILAPASPMGQGMQNTSRVGEGSIQVQLEDLQSTAAFLRFEAIYNGVTVASVLVKDEEVLSALKFDRTFEFSGVREKWDAASLSEYMKKRIKLEPLNGTHLRRMVYLHPNEKFAAYLIARVHRVGDEIIKRRILAEANGRIDYLNESLSVTTNPDHRKNLAALLMEQERLKMMVSLDQPYAATIVERPYVSSYPRWPDPYVIYPVFLLVGMLFGFVLHGIRHHG